MMDGPRACRESEFDEIIALINQVFREGTDQDIRTDYPLVFNSSKLGYMRIIKVDDKVVSHVPVAPREVITLDDTFTIGIISGTVTHPDYRRRGYATLCLRDCIHIMEEEGWPISVLWTVEGTFPFYQNSGWEAVAAQGWLYQLRTEEYDLFKAKAFDVIPYNPASPQHLEAIMKLHDAEPYRIMRSREVYRMLFSLPKITTSLAMEGQAVAAYLMFGEGINKPGLIEGGGSIEGLECLVRYVLKERSADQEIQALVPLTPTSMGQLLEAKQPQDKRPIEEASGVGYQMMRVNSLGVLLRQIENYLRTKSVGLQDDLCLVCEETEEAVTLKFRNGDIQFSNERLRDGVVLTRRQLAQLIFGAHPQAETPKFYGRAGEILQDIFPFYFPVWELDHS